ncbi:UNVERIFIED_CONTAM: hypothetical protein FKN15_023640 [Acipenser sinensis]
MLLFVTTYYHKDMAVILSKNGSLQIWYRLNTEKEPDVFSTNTTNLANGQLHRVRINRDGRDIYVQIDQNINAKYSLSSDTEFNAITSLTLGKVTGIIAVVIFITVCVTAIMTRFLYQHRKSHQTGTEKAKEHRENLEYSLRNHTDLHHSVSESKKEYFI